MGFIRKASLGEMSKTEEEGPPSKKSWPEDKPPISNSDPSAPSDTSAPDIPQPTLSDTKVFFPINEGSLHHSGISHKYLPI